MKRELPLSKNADLVNDMRDWIKDHLYDNIDDEQEVDAMTDEEMIRKLEVNYTGGYAAFIEKHG